MTVSLQYADKSFSFEPFPSVQRTYNLVRQEEKQQELDIQPPIIESNAFHTSRNQMWKNRHNNMESGAPQPNRHSGKRPRQFFDHCNCHGHRRATFYQLHGFPDGQVKCPIPHSSNNSSPAPCTHHTQDQYKKLMALIAHDTSADPSADHFAHLEGTILSCISSSGIIDSGASNQICTTFIIFFLLYIATLHICPIS